MDKGAYLGIIFLVGILAFSVIYGNNFAEGSANYPLPAVKVDKLPTENDFLSKDKHDLLTNYEYITLPRENGENVDIYSLYTYGLTTKPVMIFYFEDKTAEKLQYYTDFNSDFLFLYFKTEADEGDERFIFAERDGRGACMLPVKYQDAFISGDFSGCEGGVAVSKKTDDGWAVYVKFFDPLPTPTNESPYFVKWQYGDIQKVTDNVLEEITYNYYPEDFQFYATVSPITDTQPSNIIVNDGKFLINEFLYKPSDVLTEDLRVNNFPCAEDTLSLISDQQNYDQKDVARITPTINSSVQPVTIYLKIYDASYNKVYEKTATYTGKTLSPFLIDLKDFENGIYTAVAKFGIDGPRGEAKFSLGEMEISEETDTKCHFYTLYDKNSRQLSLLVNLDDGSNSRFDQLQIFLDRKGDGGKEPNSDDITVVIDKKRFGGFEYPSDGGWMTFEKSEELADARVKQLFGKYQVLINIPDVSANARLAIQQTDYNNFELKQSRFPLDSFPTIPETWSNLVFTETSPQHLTADKWLPKEIFLHQNLDVNLILVGDEWEPSLQNKIKNSLEKSYKPIVFSELARAGIQYDYSYNFISVSEEQSQSLFNFMSEKAKPVLPFFGEEPFDEPRGISVWIKNNHTEWVDEVFEKFRVDYKLIDAEKMENYLYENIILQDSRLNNPNSANLLFIAGDMDKVDFLHNYQLQRTDTASGKPHKAIGLMGYGANHNLYFFDLYAFPWEDFQGFSFFYDKKMQNFATNFHDIKTEDGRATLISDYVNNATSLIITPSYLYPPVYKNQYVIDLLIIGKTGSTVVGTLVDYFIDKEKIKSELEGLTPYSEWDIKVTLKDINSRDLPKEFKKKLQAFENIPLYDYPGAPTIDVFDSEQVTKELTTWAATRSSSDLKDYRDIEESSWTIPVVMVVGTGDNLVYILNEGRLASGISPEHPDDPTQPCCALGVTTDNAVWHQKISLTDLVLHEVGHTLSFMHPFLGNDANNKLFANEYFNWYQSPMTYSSPPVGCGIWYYIYVDESCGISDAYFTKFEKDNFARGVSAYLIKAAQNNVYRTMLNLEMDGKDPNSAPSEVTNALKRINSNLDSARSSFRINDLISDKGAIKYAYAAAIDAAKLAKEYKVEFESQIQPLEANLQIPGWVKNTAGWWASNEISEPDFINAIQYLIKQRIIAIPDLPESGEAVEQKVPEWVRSNAGWWAEGTITDKEFVAAIQFLVKEGVIKV